MSKITGKYLQILVAFSVALTLAAARAQIAPSTVNPSGLPQQDTIDANCASGDLSDCQQMNSINPSVQSQSGGTGAGSSWNYPSLSSGTPGSPMSVYRDNAEGYGVDRTDRMLVPRQRVPTKPLPLTEFQMLVAASVGRIVPIYGADLFTEVPDTFAPVQRLPVTPDYVIGPGDELLIRTWGQVTQNLHLTVDRSGSIYIPQVGNFRVAGLQFKQVQEFLKARLDRVYRNYDLNVNLGQLRSIQVFVTGEARKPGSYTVSSLSTLLNAVFACGGPGANGSLRHILLRRDGALIADFDLYGLLLKGDKSKDVNLATGDVLYFSPVGPQVAIVGSVRVPAIYELRGDESAGEALRLAGGVSGVANSSSLVIERTKKEPDGNSSRVAVEVTMNASSTAVPLRDADIVRVRADAPKFSRR